MKNEIEMIVVWSQTGGESVYKVGGGSCYEIKDISVEHRNSIDFLYDVLDKNGNLLTQIINCPAEVHFKKQDKQL